MKRTLPALAALLVALNPLAGAFGASVSKRGAAAIPSKGAAHFEKLCASCHGSDGLALDGEAPPLAGSSWVAGPESRLIRIVMHGVKGPIRVGDKIDNREMPGFGSRLSDEEIASLLTFVRRRWGGPGVPITRRAVSRIRAASRNRSRYWTVEELLAFR